MSSNTTTLRDHTQPCKHDERDLNRIGGRSYDGKDWHCTACPGGREIKLRKWEPTTHGPFPSVPWVEVTDESDTITLWEFPQEFYDDKGTWLLEMAGGREHTFQRVVCPNCEGWNDECPIPHDGEGKVLLEVPDE